MIIHKFGGLHGWGENCAKPWMCLQTTLGLHGENEKTTYTFVPFNRTKLKKRWYGFFMRTLDKELSPYIVRVIEETFICTCSYVCSLHFVGKNKPRFLDLTFPPCTAAVYWWIPMLFIRTSLILRSFTEFYPQPCKPPNLYRLESLYSGIPQTYFQSSQQPHWARSLHVNGYI